MSRSDKGKKRDPYMKSDKLQHALSGLRRKDGRIMPEDVVEAARPRTSPLHKYFEWSDTEAAKQFRLEQARQLLRVVVTVLPRTTTEVRAFVSLRNESGYRETLSVMVNKDQRGQLLEDARRDMESFTLKYAHLAELASIIAVMRSYIQPDRKAKSG